MKTTLRTTVVGLLLSVPVSVSAIELSDYQNPVSDYQDAFVEGSYTSKSGNQDQTSYQLNGNANWGRVHSTKSRNWRITSDGEFDLSRGPNDSDEKKETSGLRLNANSDQYLSSDNGLFWYGAGNYGYLNSAKADQLSATVGMGYGRITDASPLAMALRIQEKLEQYKVLTAPLNDETLLALADVLGKELEFISKHGRDEYLPYFFNAIEAVLSDAGALGDKGLGAAGALHIDQIMTYERHSTRRHGWLLRGGTGIVFSDYEDKADADPTIELAFEYAKPLTLKSQLDNVLKLNAINSDDSDLRWRNELRYTYELTDRVDWENRWNLDYYVPGSDDGKDVVTNDMGTSYYYFLTNKLSAGLSVNLSHVNDGIKGNGNDERSISTMLNLRYRLL